MKMVIKLKWLWSKWKYTITQEVLNTCNSFHCGYSWRCDIGGIDACCNIFTAVILWRCM